MYIPLANTPSQPTVSVEQAEIQFLQSELEVQRLDFGVESLFVKIGHLDHLRRNAIADGIGSLESAIHVAHIADCVAQGTNLNANVNVTPGLESFGADSQESMSFGENGLSAIDASLEAADTGVMGMIRKLGRAIKELLNKVLNVFRSNKTRVEKAKEKAKGGLNPGKIKVSAKQELGFDVAKFKNLPSIYTDMNQKADMARGQFKALAEKVESKVQELKGSNTDDKDKVDHDAVIADAKSIIVTLLDHVGSIYDVKGISNSNNLTHTFDAIPASRQVVVTTQESVAGSTGAAVKVAVGNVKASLSDKKEEGLKGEIDAVSTEYFGHIMDIVSKSADFDFSKGDVFTASEKIIDNTRNALAKYLSPGAADRVVSSLLLSCYKLINGIYSHNVTLFKESVETHLRIAEMSAGVKAEEKEDKEDKKD